MKTNENFVYINKTLDNNVYFYDINTICFMRP